MTLFVSIKHSSELSRYPGIHNFAAITSVSDDLYIKKTKWHFLPLVSCIRNMAVCS